MAQKHVMTLATWSLGIKWNRAARTLFPVYRGLLSTFYFRPPVFLAKAGYSYATSLNLSSS